MLEPREADVPALFLFLVVLPVFTYILLGKWSEAAKKKERISLLAQLAAEEACKAEAMTVATMIPVVPSFKSGTHECAQCFGPATTRCSKCKAVRYCSGKCQIIHWRQGHKQECLQSENTCSNLSPKPAFVEGSTHDCVLLNRDMNSELLGHYRRQPVQERVTLNGRIYPSCTDARAAASSTVIDTSRVHVLERRTKDNRVNHKSDREMLRREDGAVFDSFEEATTSSFASSTISSINPSHESYIGHKLRNSDFIISEGEISQKHNVSDPTISKNSMHGSHKSQSSHGSVSEFISNAGISNTLHSVKNGKNSCEAEVDFISDEGNLLREENMFNDETVESNCLSEIASIKRSNKSKGGCKSSKLAKTMMKASREQSSTEMEGKAQIVDESKVTTMRDSTIVPTLGSSGVTSMGFMKMMGIKKSPKPSRQDGSEVSWDSRKKIKMLFPYEEFVKFFHNDAYDLSPRGLLNCGNSCYANAVLQCLTFTKPLVIYLLKKSHSKACCVKNWCLMCELEQHVMMLRENGGPMSLSRILSQMRSINCQIGDGSQEDAHEFLRLLVTSMQSICLEGLGGEREVDPRLQETTFIQHTFGGRLKSKVKCLRCHHESERYENIMDLSLEILGWVESLEDALTQFTTPEDLDGENMYRCGRCAAYVRARKQLSIHEAPNILTIVLKRFQEGKYGKINKCITFPDMLDMIPFMTGTDDIPPLYILYAVVVHLDTLNASFSGHYVSYVKDLQGSWFRVDDAEVQPVPMSQVMSEGAYILFYMRSSPRPPRAFAGKSTQQQTAASLNHCTSKAQKTAKHGQSKPSNLFFRLEPSAPKRTAAVFSNEATDGLSRKANGNVLPVMETCREQMGMEFSDATSSDWSLFTSSDEASFTTESTRDSFSTVDYADANNIDAISSIFNTYYGPEYTSRNSVACKKFSNSKLLTSYVAEEKSCVLDSYLSAQPLDRFHKGDYLRQVSVSPAEFPSDGTCSSMFVKYGSSPKDGLVRSSANCKI